MPWEGYNSEDAVLISERLVYEDIYTSFHIRKYEIQTHVTSQEDRLLRAILGIQVSTSKETCLKLPIGGRGRVIDVRWIQKRGGSSYKPETIRVYISQKRKIKVGDKVAGRHNVGQMFECSLGLAGGLLDRHYRIAPFDERYEQEASRKLVFSELYEASKQTANPWVFEPEYPGKSRIFDGRTGNPFEQPVIIGKPYILKLIHQVDDKIHGRSSGREMEVWALEGFGVAHILQEMLTYKSDHIRARQEVLGTTIIGGTIPNPEDAPESFRLLVRELRSLALELNHFLVTKPYTFHYKTNKPEKDGLFCERIFGPIKSGICACGNYRVIGDEKEDPKFCEQCGVEFVDSRIRRYQMGYIKLACPVTHVWYLKRLPSYIANLLDKPLKELEGLVYCDV
ncbi:DNA-directed RNA polymerase subunit beta [Phtheirospermum japonicum]|uniref:DNA-directed RNA polymerase n=1 Tax=Phtheirospermum japonicum TaxID=374723 RepID=A0A830DGE9_9LAMI|nr:DNA-directed RNA polymerase subunit beta [Phtheirospermum japonicum]